MGKTKLVKEIIKKKLTTQPWLNIYNLDTKHLGDFTSRDGVMYIGEPPPVFRDGGHKVVWQPIEDDINVYSKFFSDILHADFPSIVYIDEAVNMKFGNSTNNIPRGLKILLAQGRLPGIHVFAGTQELAGSPRPLISQCTHLFGFNVEIEYDERMLMEYLRLDHLKHLGLKRWQFYHRNRDKGSAAVLYNSFEEYVSKII